MARLFALAAAAAAALQSPAAAAPPAWSWDKLQTFVHCSNFSGPLNDAAVAAMASASFAVIEKYQALNAPPVAQGAEQKVIAAAQAVRAANPNATLVFYFAVDYVRTWYALGAFFEAHPELEVHNADGSLATVTSDDHGDNTWHVFDFAQPLAQSAWALRVADVVYTRDANGARLFDGVFIDGYRNAGGWAGGLIPKATPAEQAAWLAGVNATGALLADVLGPDVFRIMNPGEEIGSFVGYNAVSIEFFAPDAASIQKVSALGAAGTFAEVHAYIGGNLALFNTTLAAYLVAVGENSYWGAGAQWDACDDWLIPHFEYALPLGAPDGPATVNGTAYARSFGGGAVKVALDVGGKAPTSCIRWAGGEVTGNAC
jgi:hypothetical protein